MKQKAERIGHRERTMNNDRLDEMIKKHETIAEENEKKASWFWAKEGNPNYENRIERAEESRQIAGYLKDLQRLKTVLGEIKEELHTPNRGTCDYFILDRIDEIIGEYEAEKGKVE